MDGRQDVIDYVTEKYGKDRVVQIVTFGTMAARMVIRDVGRVLDMPYALVDGVAKAVPMELFGLNEKDVFMEILDELSAGNYKTVTSVTDRMATIACKAAVKGNNRLSEREAKALIDELMGLENPYNCPHGRPTIISMSKYELEKKFKRIV